MDKKDEILKAALRLFTESGFHATPTSKIASEAGVANGTLFHYFKTKDDLILALYTKHQNELRLFIDRHTTKNNSIDSTFHAFYISTINWIYENQTAFQFILQFHQSPFYQLIPREYISQNESFLVELLQKGLNEGAIKQLPIELLHSLINSHVIGTINYLTTRDLSSEDLHNTTQQSFSLLWDMISK